MLCSLYGIVEKEWCKCVYVSMEEHTIEEENAEKESSIKTVAPTSSVLIS